MIGLVRRWSARLSRKFVCFRVDKPPSGPLTRTSFPIWIAAPGYNPLSGGTRAMNLLCAHLNRLGYDAYVLDTPRTQQSPVPLRYLSRKLANEQERAGREPIVVYPEVTVGNPRRARFVIRYLLNRPGFLRPGAELSYGKDDYFLSGAREHAPAGARSFDLFMPLVDHSIYHTPPRASSRGGFVVFTNRVFIDASVFPDWLKPRTLVSMREPRSHAELAELYRRSRAVVIAERSVAIFEALSCGCPIIGIANENFNESTWHPRFRDAGLIWGWREQDLDAAAEKTSRFREIHTELESSLDGRIRSAFDWIFDDVWRRVHDPRQT